MVSQVRSRSTASNEEGAGVAVFGGDTPTGNLDLALATVIALGLPFLALALFE